MRSSRYEKAIRYVLAHWKDGRTLKDIAADFDVDAGNLERAFRRECGLTVKEFVTRNRRAYTLARLKNDGVYGYEIGSELGFGSDLTFYRWVKREFGIPLGSLRIRCKTQDPDERPNSNVHTED